jgi:hypothetical protein
VKAEELRSPYFLRYYLAEPHLDRGPHEIHILPADQILEIIHSRNMNNLQLLGIEKYTPPENYNANFEILMLYDAYLDMRGYADPKTGSEIVDYTLDIPTLNPDARKKLEWFKTYLTHRSDAEKAIQANNGDALRKVYDEWTAWYKENPLPEGFRPVYSFPEHEKIDLASPDRAIGIALEHFHSNLKTLDESKSEEAPP